MSAPNAPAEIPVPPSTHDQIAAHRFTDPGSIAQSRLSYGPRGPEESLPASHHGHQQPDLQLIRAHNGEQTNNLRFLAAGCLSVHIAHAAPGRRITSADADLCSAADNNLHNRPACRRAAETAPGPDCHSWHRSPYAAGAAPAHVNRPTLCPRHGFHLPACALPGRPDNALVHLSNPGWQKILARQQ
jgi:hypothetical protein